MWHAGDSAGDTPSPVLQPWPRVPLSLTPTPTCPGAALPVPQVPCHLHEDIKETLEVRGAGAVLGVELDTVEGVRRGTPHSPPGPRCGPRPT